MSYVSFTNLDLTLQRTTARIQFEIFEMVLHFLLIKGSGLLILSLHVLGELVDGGFPLFFFRPMH